MKKAFSVVAVFLLCSGLMMPSVRAHAEADEQCENNCIQGGYEAKYCEEKCDDNSTPMTNQQTIRQVEPHCVDDCINSGHDSGYCNKACTY